MIVHLLTTAREDCWVASASALPSFCSLLPRFKYWDCVCPRNFPRNWCVCRRSRTRLKFLFNFSRCSSWICLFLRALNGVKTTSATRLGEMSFSSTGILFRNGSRVCPDIGLFVCSKTMLRPLQKSTIRPPASFHAYIFRIFNKHCILVNIRRWCLCFRFV